MTVFNEVHNSHLISTNVGDVKVITESNKNDDK